MHHVRPSATHVARATAVIAPALATVCLASGIAAAVAMRSQSGQCSQAASRGHDAPASLPMPRTDAAAQQDARELTPEEEEARAGLTGLWTRWPRSAHDGDAVRFWFFHENGIGLYRYGKIGLNTTNSFDWRVDNGELVITFRKTGEVARTPYEVGSGEPRTLVLLHDPKEPQAVPYVFVPPPAREVYAPDLGTLVTDTPKDMARLFTAPTTTGNGIAGRLWIDDRPFATGGRGFLLYQLKEAALDGRGVGWHHVGDFDDWSTEALAFRVSAAVDSTTAHGHAIELWFPVRQERATTTVRRWQDIAPDGKPVAQLSLAEDPRDFWHTHRFVDGGPSFGSLVAPSVRPLGHASAWVEP